MTTYRILPTLAALALVAAACNSSAPTGVTSTRVTSLAVAQGNFQYQTVGMPLDSDVVVTAHDSAGNPATGVSLTFMASAGTVAPASAVTDAAGQDSASWTLGTTAGDETLVVRVANDTTLSDTVTATAYADLPDSMFLYGGNDQFELPGKPLPAPIAVKVIDQYGNPVPDAPITFTATGGSLAPDTSQVPTDLNGIASVTWTLASTVGPESATAVLPDSSIGDVTNLAGSPVTFTAKAVAFAFDSVAPSPPVVGDTVTLYGMGFDPDSAGNVVSIGDSIVPILAGTQTSLTIQVPSFGCHPDEQRIIQVARSPDSLAKSIEVRPANALALAVGQSTTLTTPNGFCLQFLASAGGTDQYLVGLTATKAMNGDASFVLSGDDGVNPVPAPAAGAAALPAMATESVTPPAGELALRTWESRFFATHRGRVRATPGIALAPATPSVGDTTTYRIPNITTDPCNSYTAKLSTVIGVGPHVVVATDAAVSPTVQAGLATSLDHFMTVFGDTIYPADTTYFGTPSDLDGNGAIVLLFSSAVPALGVKTFSTAVDFTPRSTCPASNDGEVIYIGVPAAPTLANFQTLFVTTPPLLAHDLTNVIQFGRRLPTGGVPLAPWLAEAQAELGTEVSGLALHGDQPGQNYGWSVVNADSTTHVWYKPQFDKLSMLFGWDGASGTVSGAPEQCSLFGFAGATVPCKPQYAAGAEWSFLRYVSDQIAGTFAGGVPAFQRALIGNDSTSDGTGALATLAGTDVSDLLVHWAMTLYVDGRIPASAAPNLQMTSWNLSDIFDSLPAVQRLQPTNEPFKSFSEGGSLVGGGTAYALLAAGGRHGAMAVELRDAAGAALGTTLDPRLWVVRVK